MIEIKDLEKSYSGISVLKIEELKVKKNSICAFIGKNGAGKTTTIKMILGLLLPDVGNIYIHGQNIQKDNEFVEVKKEIGYVGDTPNVYENLTGYEFVEFMARIYGHEMNAQLKEEIDNWFQVFEMEDEKYKFIREYSHGMQQKVSIIGALIHKPKVLIMDEPMVGLDPQSMVILKRVLIKYKNTGGTVLLSTHILSVVEDIADEIVIMDKGRIRYKGTVSEMKSIFQGKCTVEDIFSKIVEGVQNINDM